MSSFQHKVYFKVQQGGIFDGVVPCARLGRRYFPSIGKKPRDYDPQRKGFTARERQSISIDIMDL